MLAIRHMLAGVRGQLQDFRICRAFLADYGRLSFDADISSYYMLML